MIEENKEENQKIDSIPKENVDNKETQNETNKSIRKNRKFCGISLI